MRSLPTYRLPIAPGAEAQGLMDEAPVPRELQAAPVGGDIQGQTANPQAQVKARIVASSKCAGELVIQSDSGGG